MKMEMNELLKKIEECKKGLDEIGAIGTDFYDYGKRHGAMISVQMRKDDMPNGKAVYDTSTYIDKVVKNVVIGNVAFFSLLDADEAMNDALEGDVNNNLFEDMYGALV